MRNLRGAALLLAAGVGVWSCRPETAQNETEAAAVPPAGQTACTVSDAQIRAWIEKPSLPADPAGADQACFFQFAWQQLFAVTQPEKDGPRFTTWPTDQALFPEKGHPPRWETGFGKMTFRQLSKARGIRRSGGVAADIVTEAAALTPLTDQRGRWAHYSVVVNRPEYEYIRCCELYRGDCFNDMGGVGDTPGTSRIERPPGSLELKMAWRILETCDLPDSPVPCTPEDASRYLTVDGEVQPYSPRIQSKPVKATLGLMGMHIVQKTPNYKDSVWATFEHVDNAPDCTKEGDPPAAPPAGSTGWSFFNPNCQDPGKTGRCDPNAYCAPCPIRVPKAVTDQFNLDHKGTFEITQDPKTGEGIITCVSGMNTILFNKPVVVDGTEYWINLFDPACTAAAIPTQVCRSADIASDVAQLNEQVHRVLEHPGGRSSALSNYELVGVIWYNGKNLEPASRTALANTTMETYLQPLSTGCVTCHSTVPPVEPVPESKDEMLFNSGLADRSMVFQQMRQFGAETACSAQQWATCSTWESGCPAR